MDLPKEFPVLMDNRKKFPTCPLSIPWAMIAPHERQALRNHDQTLQRLAERGGLSTCEMVAVLEDRRWKKMDVQESIDQLLGLVKEWKEKNP